MPVLSSVVIAQTWFLPDGAYQIDVSPDLESKAQRTPLLTRDPEIYTMAMVAEGYPIRFDATWHPAKRSNGRRCQVLEALTLTNSQ